MERAGAKYGSSGGPCPVPIQVTEGKDQPCLVTESGNLLSGDAFQQVATPERIEEMRAPRPVCTC